MTRPPEQVQARPQGLLLGDTSDLTDCLGSPGTFGALSRHVAFHHRCRVTTPAELRAFLADYRHQLLLPVELPAIRLAFEHAHRYEVRELLTLDRQQARHPLPPEFAFASQAIGQRYLRRLRPLRDVRLVHRYLDAIHAHRAFGWHTFVYGVVLSIYSLPLRQGLLSYGRQTLGGFLDAATFSLRLSSSLKRELTEECLAHLPGEVNRLLREDGGSPRGRGLSFE